MYSCALDCMARLVAPAAPTLWQGDRIASLIGTGGYVLIVALLVLAGLLAVAVAVVYPIVRKQAIA